MKNISKEVLNEKKFIVNFRRDLHANPEVGQNEFQTSKKIATHLKTFGLDVKEKVGGTGVIGLLKSKNKKAKTILVRADMDALPIQETNTCSYKSKNNGIMHACGHDGHSAINIGLAKVLSKMKDIPNHVKFMFQPDEEGNGGALPMIKQGLLKNPKVDKAFAVHLSNDLNTGAFSIRDEYTFATSTHLDIEILGKSTHGAQYHTGIDSIFIASQIVNAIYGIISRDKSPSEEALISICKINGGTARNAIAKSCKLEGIIRTFDPKTLKMISKRINQIVNGIAKTYNTKAIIEINNKYPATKNDQPTAVQIRKIAAKKFGTKNIRQDFYSFGGEDMSYVLNEVPGCYIIIGANKKNGAKIPWHNDKFDIDENALLYGVELLKEVIWKI